MSVQLEIYKGHKILISDYRGLKGKKYLDAMEETENELLKHEPGSIMTITDVTNTYTDDAIKDRSKLMVERTGGIARATAVVGVTGLKQVIAKAIKKDIYFAASVEEAKEWLLNQT